MLGVPVEYGLHQCYCAGGTMPERGRSLRRSEREDLVDALKARMNEPESQQLYKKRAASIERCFGAVKANRGLT